MSEHELHAPHSIALRVLTKIYDETLAGKIVWSKRDDANYAAPVSPDYPFPISFDFQGVESHPLEFTSRAFVNLQMPGMNHRFFNGTEGFEILYSLLLWIETGEQGLGRYDDALTRLNSALSDDEAS